MIELPEECLAENLEGACEPLAQDISDCGNIFDCCGRILQEDRIEPDLKFRKCQGYMEGSKGKTQYIDITERELISVMTNIANALHVIANMRENVEVKEFKKPVLVVDNERGAKNE